jgi:hypothetical protein
MVKAVAIFIVAMALLAWVSRSRAGEPVAATDVIVAVR